MNTDLFLDRPYQKNGECFIIHLITPTDDGGAVLTKEVVKDGRRFHDEETIPLDTLIDLTPVKWSTFYNLRENCADWQKARAVEILRNFTKLCAANVGGGAAYSPPYVAPPSVVLWLYRKIKATATAADNDELINDISLELNMDGALVLEVGDATPGGASAFGCSLFLSSTPTGIKPEKLNDDDLAATLSDFALKD
jgi:hypothetical protein